MTIQLNEDATSETFHSQGNWSTAKLESAKEYAREVVDTFDFQQRSHVCYETIENAGCSKYLYDKVTEWVWNGLITKNRI